MAGRRSASRSAPRLGGGDTCRLPWPIAQRLAVWWSVGTLVIYLSGCASAPPTGAAVVMTELFFGMSRIEGGRTVDISESDWQRFVEESIAASFPDGFTVVEALGQYRSGIQGTVRERSKLVIIVHRAVPLNTHAIDDIVAEYKRRFGQEEVLRVSIPLASQ